MVPYYSTADMPSGVFDPLTTPNLISAFEAETGVYTTTGRTTLSGDTDSVGSWTDQVNGWHIGNINGDSSLPILRNNKVGGLPVVQCSSVSSQFLLGTTNLGLTSNHAFSVSLTFKLLATTINGTLMGFGSGAGGTPRYFYLQQDGSTNTLYINAESGYNAATDASTVDFTTNFSVVTFTYNGTDLKYYNNGVLLSTLTIPFVLEDSPLTMFSGPSNGNQFGDNQVQSLWIANVAWTDADREALENYQSTKCGGLF